MSRSRAEKDPFWATALNKMQPGPAEIVVGMYEMIQANARWKPVFWMGSGWRTGSSEHASGTAIDVIVTENTGKRPTAAEHKIAMELITWAQQNAKILGLEHLLYSPDQKNQVQSWNPNRGSWKKLGNRGSISGNHIDHIHFKFSSKSRWPKSNVLGPNAGGLSVADITAITKSLAALTADVKYLQEQLRAVAGGTYSREAINARNKDISIIVERAVSAGTSEVVKQLGGTQSQADNVTKKALSAVEKALNEITLTED